MLFSDSSSPCLFRATKNETKTMSQLPVRTVSCFFFDGYLFVLFCYFFVYCCSDLRVFQCYFSIMKKERIFKDNFFDKEKKTHGLKMWGPDKQSKIFYFVVIFPTNERTLIIAISTTEPSNLAISLTWLSKNICLPYCFTIYA